MGPSPGQWTSPLDPNTHRQAGEIFCRALERDDGERVSYVEQQCAGDAALLEAVRNLLAHDGGREGFDAEIAKSIRRR